MPELIALDFAGGPEFVDSLQRCWDDGHAVFPIDQRLPPPARAELLAAIRPTAVEDRTGRYPLSDGIPVELGDALVVATSGSSGNPKGVILTHAAVEASARASSRALEVTAHDHWLACLPLAHIGGLSVVTRALITDTRLTVLPRFDADTVDRLSSTCTLVSLVATALGRIHPEKYRRILLGGSRVPADLPPNVVATYGMTETGSGIVYDGFPLDDVEIEIATDGEILVRAPMLMRAYRDGTTSIDGNGWLHTDDEGWLDDDGRLHVIGRRGDVIVTGGQKVWPEAVERELTDILGRDEMCIIGIRDSEWGERVVLATTRSDLDLAQIRDAISSVLPGYSAPREIRVIDEIPRTSIGKVARGRLRNLLESAH